ncbi:hypothetical protein [Roseovarius sp.]|uniref:hypothetical protein n=1 Tax=Roseovarius sp. TaxID=1486281 RepID=UPI003A9856D4
MIRKDQDPTASARIWLNVGYYHTNKETGEETFVGLPAGLPIDTMAFLNARAAEDSNLFKAKNALLRELLSMGRKMPLGQGQDVCQLKVQIRRFSEPDELEALGNPYLETLRELDLTRGTIWSGLTKVPLSRL